MRTSKAERDASFAAFMDQAGPALLRTAWFLTGDTDRAQELTQAALVKTYLVWHRIDHGRAQAYARKCLVNAKIDGWRSTRREVVADVTRAGFEPRSASVGSLWQRPAEDVTTADHRDDLVWRLSRLPAQQRKVVVLRYYADQSEAVVADALGISVGSVKSAASRGLAALRRQEEAQPSTDGERRRTHEAQLPPEAPRRAADTSPSTEGSLR